MNITALIFSLIGVVVGGLISLFGIWMNNRQALSREYYRAAADLAKEDYAAMIKMVENTKQRVLPLESFYIYYLRYFKIIRKKKFKPRDLDKLAAYKNEIMDYYREGMKK